MPTLMPEKGCNEGRFSIILSDQRDLRVKTGDRFEDTTSGRAHHDSNRAGFLRNRSHDAASRRQKDVNVRS
jgi:hypothetical protein